MYEEEMNRQGFVFLSGQPGVMAELHRHREVEVNLVVEGEMEYLFGGRRVAIPEGQLAVFWATIPHGVVRTAAATRAHCIHLPLVRFLQWQVSSDLVHRLLNGEIVREPDAASFPRDRALFEQWRQDVRGAFPDACRVVLLELEARLRRLGWGIGTTSGGERPNTDAAMPRDQGVDHVERMAVFMSERYQERLTADDIAGAAGLHPKYAITLFRGHCGMTPAEYLTQQRLSQAQRLLATTDAKVVDIAFTAGFGSVSQFYEVFTRVCGQTPKDFRASQK